jgi:hypothetical protein
MLGLAMRRRSTVIFGLMHWSAVLPNRQLDDPTMKAEHGDNGAERCLVAATHEPAVVASHLFRF